MVRYTSSCSLKVSETSQNNCCSQPVNCHGHAIVDIREVVPAIGVAEGVGGLPFAQFRSVVAEEEGVAKFADVRFAGEEASALSLSPKAVIRTGVYPSSE